MQFVLMWFIIVPILFILGGDCVSHHMKNDFPTVTLYNRPQLICGKNFLAFNFGNSEVLVTANSKVSLVGIMSECIAPLNEPV